MQSGEVDALPESAGAIVAQCDRMSGLISQMLDFVRPRQRGEVDLDLVDLTRQTLELVDPLARKAQVRLGPPPAGERVEVCADAGALQQVLLNLVVNGIQAMPQGGPLRVEVGARGDEAVLSVIDAGVGIPEALRERIFEPFFTTKERGVGTGLGLCVVRDIVAEHGGSLAVESAPGQGTRIDVRLPLAQVGTRIA
jgi:signal transduction histidine kinase